jgi:N-acetylmuramoyl-L-alanine amidase
MPDPKSYHFDLDPTKRPANATLAEEWYPNIQDAAMAASSSRIYDAVAGIRAIVIHATAGGSSSGAASVIFDGNASFHWLVPDEDEQQHGKFVWATCHEARAAWHVRNSASHPAIWNGNNKVNHYSLGIEVVNRQVSSDAFSDWQVKATAEIVRYCWAKYPNLRHVVSHAKLDPARRSDPGSLFPWDKFKAAVLAAPTPAPALALAMALPEMVKPPTDCCMV